MCKPQLNTQPPDPRTGWTHILGYVLGNIHACKNDCNHNVMNLGNLWTTVNHMSYLIHM